MSITLTRPPYPRLGECYRTLALAFGTKSGNRAVDRLAREGDYDSSLLPQLTHELLLAPLGKYVDPEFAELIRLWTDHMLTRYREVVLGTTLDSIGRTEALPVLVTCFFAPEAVSLLVGAHIAFGGPDLPRLLSPENSPIEVVLTWLGNHDMSLAKAAFPATTGSDRTRQEMVRKWMRGAELPDLASIKLFADAIEKRGTLSAEKTAVLRRWLVLSRALAYVDSESPAVSTRSEMLSYLALRMPAIDVAAMLAATARRHADRLRALSLPALTLYEDLKRLTVKRAGDMERTRRAIDALEQLSTKEDPEEYTAFHLAWIKARWFALSGDLEQALGHYEKAVERGNYRAGAQQASILEEALALAAFLADRTSLKRLKHFAVAAGLFITPTGDAIIEHWEIEQISQQLYRLFPASGRFPEACSDDRHAHFGILMLDEAELDRLQPDMAKPDRVRTVRFPDGQIRRWPQLRLFASFGRVEKVQALLQAGASVDLLDESGGSALLCSLQYAQQTGNRRALDLVIAKAHAAATIDSITSRKRLSLLICAIDYGEVDILERLLAMGATPDLRANIGNTTPLYHIMGVLVVVQQPAKLRRHLERAATTRPDLMQQEALRRHGVTRGGIFGSGNVLEAMQETQRHREILEKLIDVTVDTEYERHTVSKLIRMVALLLQRGANPNARHDYPASGRTPLMLAAENNDVQAFGLMLRHRGDPFLTDGAGYSCIQIAQAFQSVDVLALMREQNMM